jgi:hypothetical protein
VSDFLAELRDEVTAAHAAHARRGRRRPRAAGSSWRRDALLGAVAVAATVLALVVAVPLLQPPAPVGPRVVDTVAIGGIPVDGVLHEGSLWIADHAGARVLRVDPRERRVRARIALPGAPVAIAAEGAWAAVWATDDNVPPEGLYRIGAAGERRRLGLQSVGELAAAGDVLWALTTPGELVRIDASTGRLDRRWPQLVPAAGATAGGHALVADPDGAWVLSTPRSGGGSLVRVQGDRAARRIEVVPGALPMLAVTPDGLWLARTDEAAGRSALSRIDPGTGEVAATVDLGRHRPAALVPVGRAVWVLGGDGRLLVVAP